MVLWQTTAWCARLEGWVWAVSLAGGRVRRAGQVASNCNRWHSRRTGSSMLRCRPRAERVIRNDTPTHVPHMSARC